jgi:hypothetical protein
MRKVITLKYFISFISILCLSTAISLAASDGEVGRIKKTDGKASIVRDHKEIQVKIEEKIFKGDTIKTGPDGSLGVIFKDDALLSLGPDSELVIDEFLYAPSQGKLSFVTRLLKGTAAFFSGVIAKLSPQSVRFETPEATVAIRGTKFLVRVEPR